MSPTSSGLYIMSSSTCSLNHIFKSIIFIILIIVISMKDVCCEENKNYHMNQLCKNHFLRQLYKKIDGAVLLSQNERNLDCIVTFQTHSILQRFMLRFDTLSLDCNDHLYIYDGGHANQSPKYDLSCRNTKLNVGAFLTNTNFITLKYVTDNWGTDSNGFKLVITAVKDPKHDCKDFRCQLKEFCIHPDLICDGVNHCGDASDENVSAMCQSQTENKIFGLELTWIVLIAVSSILVIFACLVGVAICLCRTRNSNTNNNLNVNQLPLHQTTLESNGSSKHVSSTLPRETRLPVTSGNALCPAGKLGKANGSHTIPRNFNLCLETRIPPPSQNTQILNDGSPSDMQMHHVSDNLMKNDLLQHTTNTATSQKDEWFV